MLKADGITQEELANKMNCSKQYVNRIINGKDSVAFFRKTSLPIDILKKIWINASSTGNTLDKDEFFVALKLISYS